MTAAQRLKASQAFWLDEQATDDQIQAVLLIARQRKFRPKSVLNLDVDRKTKHLATLSSVPDGVAARTLIVYHLAEQRPLMGAFLDALGIAHESGLIQDDEVKPAADKLAAAVAHVTERFPQEDVSLYLQTLLSQDPNTWGGLAELVPALEGSS